MKKKILITGSAGFAGSHLVEHVLSNTDWEVVGIDSFRHRGDSLRLNGDWKRYEMFCHDLAAPISDRLMQRIGPVDFIVNMAAESHVDRSLTDPVPFVTNNVALALNVLEYARQVKPQKFIQISTDEVYGPALDKQFHGEWSPILPSNPYAASKAAQEAIAVSYWRSYGVPLVITNTMNMFGERQDTEKFIPMLIKKISKDQEVIIHGTEEKVGSRHYLHARNHADALLFLLREINPIPYEDSDTHILKPCRFNVVGDVEMDNFELALTVADILERPLKYKLQDFHSARPGHDRRYALDGTTIKLIGWHAPIPFLDSLKRTIQWSLQHPEWLV